MNKNILLPSLLSCTGLTKLIPIYY